MTLYLVALERNLTIIGRGSSCLALRGFGGRWLTSMSLCTNGGSNSRISLASSSTAPVVSSFSFSGSPEIRKLFPLPYCSRSSWSSFNCFISSFNSAIVASRSAKLALRLRISVCSVDRLSRRSLLVDLMIQANLSDILWSSSASSNASLKRASCSTGSREESLRRLLLYWPRLPIVQGIEDTGTAQESSGAINSFQSYWEHSKFQTDQISDINIHPWCHLLESIWSWVIHNEVVHFPELCRAYTWGNWKCHLEPMTAACMPPQRSEVIFFQ